MIDKSYDVQKMNRMCCCLKQPHITIDDLNNLAKNVLLQLRNLPETFRAEIEGASSFDIREFFSASHIPFRWEGCTRGSMSCCCSCTRLCNHRCPQDVMHRAYLFCGNILEAQSEEEARERYNRASIGAQMLYLEMTSKNPRYFAIASMVTELSTPIFNKKLERYIQETGNVENPYKIDYAPVIVMEEEHITHPNGYVETRWRKKVDSATGNVAYIPWPGSGMCPYCLPTGLVDRRRKDGIKHPKRRKKHERGADALGVKKQD